MRYISYVSILIFLISCKKENTAPQTKATKLSVAEKIANAHGFNNWKNVSTIEFTLNVDRDSSHYDRQWKWEPKKNRVTINKNKDNAFSYNTTAVDSTSIRTDQGFINDKFWLLAPFNLVWDQGTTLSTPIKDTTLISKTILNKITLLYPEKGGYTPGDAYDFYYNDDFIIQEWVFRQGNSKTPSLATKWEDYKTFNGLKIATSHKRSNSNWHLYFTDIKVISKTP